jgi:hypothetical protein
MTEATEIRNTPQKLLLTTLLLITTLYTGTIAGADDGTFLLTPAEEGGHPLQPFLIRARC